MEYAIVQLPIKAGQVARYYAGNIYGTELWNPDIRNAVLFDWSSAIERRDVYRAEQGLTMEGRLAVNVINVV